jgi:hypothetical protein
MKFTKIVGATAEDSFDNERPAIPGLETTDNIIVTGTFYVKSARCSIVMPGSSDLIDQWDDTEAKLRKFELPFTSSVEVRPGGSCAIYCRNAVTNSVAQAIASEPVHFSGSVIAVEQYHPSTEERSPMWMYAIGKPGYFFISPPV